jgi:hypothetical protein
MHAGGAPPFKPCLPLRCPAGLSAWAVYTELLGQDKLLSLSAPMWPLLAGLLQCQYHLRWQLCHCLPGCYPAGQGWKLLQCRLAAAPRKGAWHLRLLEEPCWAGPFLLMLSLHIESSEPAG